MRLLKRLVTAIEKIADKKEDYSEFGKVFNEALRVQASYQVMARRTAMKDRYLELTIRQRLNMELTDKELEEIKIGNEMFDKSVLEQLIK